MQLGTREIRHIILNNQVVNSSRALHSLKHTVPKSHKNIAIHMVDHIRRLGVFPANYALDLGEFIDSNGNSYIDIVELNPISCSICYVNNSIYHRRGHITEEQYRIFLLGCQMLCDFDCCYRLAAAGTAPNGEDAASGLLHRLQLLRLRIAAKEATFQEIHSVASLSAEGSAPSLSLDSVPSAVSLLFSGSGSAYSSSIRASCAAMNLAAFSGVPRYTSARCS